MLFADSAKKGEVHLTIIVSIIIIYVLSFPDAEAELDIQVNNVLDKTSKAGELNEILDT